PVRPAPSPLSLHDALPISRVARACAAVESLLGRQEQARARLARALEALPDHGSPEAVALMLELVVNALWRTRHEEMHEAAERAVDRKSTRLNSSHVSISYA